MNIGFYETLSFLGLLLPLTLSPGPVNITLAGLGCTVGVNRSLPFFAGLSSSALIIAILSGVGLSEIFIAQSGIYHAIRYAGIAYIFYLSYKFFVHKPSNDLKHDPSHGFMDGFLLTSLNPKFYIMVAVLFGQFLTPNGANMWILVILFVGLLSFSQLVWLAGGHTLNLMLRSTNMQKTQNMAFGLLLAASGLYLLLSNG